MRAQRIQRFFAVKGDIQPTVQRVIADIKRKNALNEFVENLASKQGFPAWDKAKIIIAKHTSNTVARDFDSSSNPSDTIVQIPLVNDSNTVVTSFIQATLNITINETLYCASDYKDYFPLVTGTNQVYEFANNYAKLFIKMQIDVIGTRAFDITDDRLLNFTDPTSGVRNHILKFGKFDGVASSGYSTQNAARKWLVITLENGCQELWFNDNDNAGFDDDGWYFFDRRGKDCGGGGGGDGSTGNNPTGNQPSGPNAGNGPTDNGGWYPTGGGNPINNPPPYNPILVGWLSSEDPPNIVSNVTNPCLAHTIKRITNQGLTNEISKILNQVFGLPNSNSNLIFVEGTPANGYPAETKIISINGTTYTIQITLSVSILSGASQEYVASVIMHEILHAFLTVNGTAYDALTQHYLMAKDYTDKLITALKKMFPNLSPTMAAALALRGYNDLLTNQNYQQFFASLLANYNLTMQDFNDINKDFKHQDIGTPCQ